MQYEQIRMMLEEVGHINKSIEKNRRRVLSRLQAGYNAPPAR